VAGDMPAGIETHLAFAVGKNLDAFSIEAVEARIRQDVPVRGKKVMQTFELPLAGEVAGCVRKRLVTLEDVAKPLLHAFVEERPMSPQMLAIGLFQPGKAQPVAQAAALRSRCSICRRNLRQDNVPR